MIPPEASQYGTSKNPSSLEKANFLKRLFATKYPGIWKGFVEDIHDPFRLKRVRVRIPTIHKGPTVVPTAKLPWATRASMFGGGFDYGAHMPLPVGSGVWVMFENESARNPVVIGTYNAIPRNPQVFGQFQSDHIPVEDEDSSMGPWKQRCVKGQTGETADSAYEVGQSEVPSEARQIAFHEPTISLPFKSWKGAAVVIEDRDAYERMDIVDRAGQGIRMQGNIKKEYNASNATQRGLRSVFRGDQYNYAMDTDNREASVSIRDLAQQGVDIQGRKFDEHVKISSKVARPDDGSSIDFDMGANVHTIDLSAGHRRTVIAGKTGGNTMFRLSFDSQKGIIDLEGKSAIRIRGDKVTIVANSIVIQGDATIDGDLVVSGDATAIGKIVSGDLPRDKPRNYR